MLTAYRALCKRLRNEEIRPNPNDSVRRGRFDLGWD
jgi:hypothetical protein